MANCLVAVDSTAIIYFFGLVVIMAMMIDNLVRSGAKGEQQSAKKDDVKTSETNSKRIETAFEVRDKELKMQICAHLVEFGTPYALPLLMEPNETEDSLVEPTDDCQLMQMIMLLAIEDDEEEWRSMHVLVDVEPDGADVLKIRLSLPRSVAPVTNTSSCEFVCKTAMRTGFLKKIRNAQE
jgi:hypothetical protein